MVYFPRLKNYHAPKTLCTFYIHTYTAHAPKDRYLNFKQRANFPPVLNTGWHNARSHEERGNENEIARELDIIFYQEWRPSCFSSSIRMVNGRFLSVSRFAKVELIARDQRLLREISSEKTSSHGCDCSTESIVLLCKEHATHFVATREITRDFFRNCQARKTLGSFNFWLLEIKYSFCSQF